jgi:hypothetical protein
MQQSSSLTPEAFYIVGGDITEKTNLIFIAAVSPLLWGWCILQLSRAILSRCRLPSTLWLTWLSGQLSFKLTELLEPPLTFPDILVCTSHSSKRPDFAFCSVVAWNPLDRL